MIVVTDTRRGGTPHKLAMVARGMSRRGWKIVFVSVMPGGSVLEDARGEGITTHSLGVRSLHQAPNGYLKLTRLIRSEKPDIVQTALWHADLLGRMACLGSGVPLLNGHENVDDDKPRRRTFIDRLTNRIATGHYALSTVVADRVATRDHIPRGKITVIPVGLDAEKFKPQGRREEMRRSLVIPQDAPVVGWIGRFHPQKNLRGLIEVMTHLPKWWLVLGGYGSEQERVTKWIRRHAIEDRVVMVGEVSDVPSLLEVFDVYCLTSFWEGMPLAIMEAMAAGLPVVTTPVGGIPELITDGVDGLFVRATDARGTAEAIERAAADQHLGLRAAETIRKNFSVKAMVDRFEDLWKSVSSGRG